MRVKGGSVTRKRRRKIIKSAKGYYGAKRKLYKKCNEQLMKSRQYAFNSRSKKKSFFRQIWIVRINGALKKYKMSYSQFMWGLKLAVIDINRKMLSEIVIENPKYFESLVNSSKIAINNFNKNIKR